MSGESEVTYVGGRAAEQTEAVETQLPSDEREAAVKAVKDAIKQSAKEVGEKAVEEAEEADKNDIHKPKGMKVDKPEKDPKTGKFLPKDGAKEAAEEDVDEDEVDVKKVLKQREKLAAKKAQAQQEFQRQQYEIRQAYAEVQRAKAEVEREKQKIAALKSDPVKAVRDAGWDPEEFILSLAKEGTEEGKMARLIREQQQKLAEIDAWKAEQAKQREEAVKQAEQRQAADYRNHVERKFLQHVSDEEKFPHTQAFYKGREASLIAEGDMVAAQYRELTGKEASLEDIAEYIEEVLAERANAWYERNAKSSKVIAPNVAGKPARGATGKTLTNSDASDRRSAGKNLADLDGEDRLEAAKAAVAAALAGSKGTD